MPGMGMGRVVFDLHNSLTAWQWGPFPMFILVLLVLIAYWYMRSDWLLAGRGRRWPRRRTVSFMLGLFSVDLALQSPVATYTGMYFQAHVVQHLLLMVVAPPLLAQGAPSTLLLQTSSRRTKRMWLGVLKSRPFAVLTHPVLVWFLYFGLMFAFFLSSLINVAMNHMALMDAFNLLFLFSATLYWWPLVGVDPIVHWRMGYGARMVSVLLGGPPEVILGLAILSQRTPIASMYSLSSTHAGGGLLWISTEFATFGGFVPIFLQWMKSDARMAARADTRSARLELNGGVDRTPELSPADADAAQRLDFPQWQQDAWEAMWKARGRPMPTTTYRSRPEPAGGAGGPAT